MLIIPIRLTELISFCGSGVLAFDAFVSGVLAMFPMSTETAAGNVFIPRPNGVLNIPTNKCTSLQSKANITGHLESTKQEFS